jgi:hypothetical protein
VFYSFKDISKRGSDVKGYYLITLKLSYSYRLIENSLIYIENQNLLSAYRQLVALTYKYRKNVILYS